MPHVIVSHSLAGRTLWSDTLRGHALCMAGSDAFAAVALSDASLHVYFAAGRRALPPVDLGAPGAMMAADGRYRLLVLTADGKLLVWDLELVGLTGV